MNNLSSLSDDGTVRPLKPAPPFLNSCTKAAEAITFLIEHLLRTTPEWLACHNEADSAIHIAERVHALNVSLAAKNVSLGTPLTSGAASQVSSVQAKSQYRRTRAFRKTVADLDKFTMPDDYRPELLTQELIVRGTARDRLVRCMKQMMQHRMGEHYYRLPRVAPELDSLSESEGSEQERLAAVAGTGHDHLELKLAYMDERVWIRYYNIRVQDHVETRNGSETWQEILHPYSPPTPELELDEDGEEEMMDHQQQPFGFSMMEELSLPIYEADESEDGQSSNSNNNINNKQRAPRRRLNSKGGLVLSEDDVSEDREETMDPPQISTHTFLEIFGLNPSSVEVSSAMGDPNVFLGGQQNFGHQKGGSVNGGGGFDSGYDQPYYPGYGSPQVSVEGFDPSMVLDGSSHGRPHSSTGVAVSSADQSGRYCNVGAFLHQDRPPQGQTQYPQELFQPSSHQHQPSQQPHHRPHATHPLQQDPNGSFPHFDLHTGALGFDPSTSSPSYSAPDSPNQQPPLETNLGLGLVAVSTPLSALQGQMSMDGGHYLSLVQQQFPNQHIPSQPQGSMDFQQQQTLQSALNGGDGGHPNVRPFYGMPMGGFMTPGLDSLPVINRTTQGAASYYGASTSNNNNTSAVGQALSGAQSSGVWAMDSGAAGAVASYLAKSEPHSPALPPSLVSSVPTSPIPMHQSSSSFRLMLSPTSESIQGISNRMNAWDGISGPKASVAVDGSDLQGPTLMEYSSSTGFHHHQQQQQHHHHQQHQQHHQGSLLETPPVTGGSVSASHYGSSWSSASSTSELTTTTSTPAGSSSSTTTTTTTRMDGIEAGPSSKSTSTSVSAVPETPFGDYGGVAGLDGGSSHKLISVVDDREGDKDSLGHGQQQARFNPHRAGSITGRSR